MKFQNQLCSFGGEQALIVKRPRKMPFLRNLKKERFLHGCFGLSFDRFASAVRGTIMEKLHFR
jgi:hypothetical protein